jgi:hypothetical protein
MSRYPRPGQIVPGYMDDGRHVPVFVLGTSRHKIRFTEAEALTALTAYLPEWEPGIEPVVGIQYLQWRSVRRQDLDLVDADEGEWHSEGGGAAWVDAAYPKFAARSKSGGGA